MILGIHRSEFDVSFDGFVKALIHRCMTMLHYDLPLLFLRPPCFQTNLYGHQQLNNPKNVGHGATKGRVYFSS